MNKKLLLEFCPTDHEGLKQPYSIGDYTCATDGMVLIRIPRLDEFSENPLAPDPEKIDVEDPEKWYPISGIKMPKKVICDFCGGEGRNFECPECGGEGTVWLYNDYNEYNPDCKSCDGSGKMAFCENCGGTGKTPPPRKPIDFNGVTFDQKYLALLSKLPNCEIGLVSKTATTPFRFDGGTGIIMPMRTD